MRDGNCSEISLWYTDNNVYLENSHEYIARVKTFLQLPHVHEWGQSPKLIIADALQL
jgi:hypothetical protein